MMRLVRIGALCALMGVGATGCVLPSLTKILLHPPSQVQLTVAAADAADVVLKLGEVVGEIQVASHKLALGHVIAFAQDETVQRAAQAYADGSDQALKGIQAAANGAILLASVAPLIGSASTIITSLQNVPTVGVKGSVAVVAGNLPSLLAEAKTLMGKLQGGKS